MSKRDAAWEEFKKMNSSHQYDVFALACFKAAFLYGWEARKKVDAEIAESDNNLATDGLLTAHYIAAAIEKED